jgi:hypothetical protein
MYLAASAEVTLLLNVENLCTSSCLLFKSHFQHFISFHSIFSLFKANIMLMCCSLTSAIFLVCHNEQEITQQTHMQRTYSKLEMTQQTLLYVHPGVKYRVIRNDCQNFNNLSYTIHLRQEYVVALMDQEISISTNTSIYHKDGMNLIIVLMFVESQRVHIYSTSKVCNKNLECCSI